MTVIILEGDVLERLKQVQAKSVQTVMSSPPYFGLRDFGTGRWEGGDVKCPHTKRSKVTIKSSTLSGGKRTTGHQHEGGHATCKKCGAKRIDLQLGMERTPQAYIHNIVRVMREVRRVLRDDGTVWLNLGDSYVGTGGQSPQWGGIFDGRRRGKENITLSGRHKPTGVWKTKDLVGIPWRTALALQADGWYLRQDIIWHKPNPMPESVKDRCTKSHEYIFLLTKKPRYFFDAYAISEEIAASTVQRMKQHVEAQQGSLTPSKSNGAMKAVASSFAPFGGTKYAEAAADDAHHRTKTGNHYDATGGRRTKRSVWTVTTKPFGESHFATFPPELVEPCLKAGTSAHGACAKCGAPWRRVVRTKYKPKPGWGKKSRGAGKHGGSREVASAGWAERGGERRLERQDLTISWKPTCKHRTKAIKPCVVLDMFGGAGTTSLVAERLRLDSVMVELSPDYVHMARRRIEGYDDDMLRPEVRVG